MGDAQRATDEDMEATNSPAVEELRVRHNELKKQLDALNRHIALTPAD